MKALTLFALVLSQLASANTKIDLNSMLYQHSNIDNLVGNIGIGQDVKVFENTLSAEKKFKGFFKTRGKSKTSLNLLLTDIGSAYDDVKLINDDDVNTTLRNINLTQRFSFAKKVSKSSILSAGIDLGISQGFNIEQEFPSGADIKYHVISDEYTMGAIDLGAAFRISKANTLKLKYKLSQFDHKNPYTFLEIQGTNSRRIETLAIQDKHKISKTTYATLAIQVHNTTYRDRLALDNVGLFRESGKVQASRIQDQSINAGLSFFRSALKVNVDKTQRIDLIDNGDGFDKMKLSAEITKSWKIAELKLLLDIGEKEFKSQVDDSLNNKRKDNTSTKKLSVSFNLGGSFKSTKPSVFYEQRTIDSNNSFGDYGNINRAGVALMTKF